jgi:hypothetical protein
MITFIFKIRNFRAKFLKQWQAFIPITGKYAAIKWLIGEYILLVLELSSKKDLIHDWEHCLWLEAFSTIYYASPDQ